MERIGPYEIIGELGRGAMGVVYRARHAELDREFAVKVIHPNALADTPALQQRFRREAQAAGRASGHPGIVSVTDVGEEGGALYVAMELVEGGSLADTLTSGDHTPERIAGWGRDIAYALAHAHQAGVLHRDVKPGNILIGADGKAQVGDFGLARLQQTTADVTQLTRTGELLGTPAYMPPEQITGDTLDARADVYALGATLYEALAGAPPFAGDTLYQTFTRALNEPPAPLRSVAPGCPEPLERIVHCCLAKSREARYGSADLLADDLSRFLAGEPVQAPALSGAPAAARRAGCSAASLAIGAAVVALAAGGVAWWAATRAGIADTQSAATERHRETGVVEQAGRMAQAWYACQRDTGAAFRRCEDRWNRGEVTNAEAVAALAALQAATQEIEADLPGTAAPRAWRLLAGIYAGVTEAEAALADAVAAHPDDPFPRLIAARHALTHYARLVHIPRVDITVSGVTLREIPESAEAETWRAQADTLLAGLDALPAWREVPAQGGPRAFAAAASALARGDFAGADRALQGVTDDEAFGTTARRLSAIARYRTGDFRGAAEEWEALFERRWLRPYLLAGMARAAAAVQESGTTDPQAELDSALGHFDRLLAREPLDEDALVARTMTAWAKGEFARVAGADPRPHYRAALPPVDRALDALPRAPISLLMARGQLLAELIGADIAYRDDPTRWIAGAERDLRASVAQAPGDAHLRRRLGLVLADAMRTAPRGSDRERRYGAAARAEFRRAIELDGTMREVWADLASACSHLAGSARSPEAAWSLVSEGIAAGERGLAAATDDPTTNFILGGLHLRRAKLLAARGEDAAAAFQAAVRAFQVAVAAQPERAPARERLADTLIGWGFAEYQAQRDGRALVDRGLALLDELVERFPRGPASWFNRATARERVAKGAAVTGHDPLALRRGALTDLRAAIERAPQRTVMSQVFVEVASRVADDTADRAERGELRSQAAEAADRCAAQAPQDPQTWLVHARAHDLWWQHLGADPADHERIHRIAASYRTLMELQPRFRRDFTARVAALEALLKR